MRKRERIGQMRHRVSIRQYSISRNAAGEEILSWSELAEVWAAIDHKTASGEGEQLDRVTAQINVVFTIRYRSGIDEKMRILWNSKIWNIRSLLPDNHLDYLMIEAESFET